MRTDGAMLVATQKTFRKSQTLMTAIKSVSSDRPVPVVLSAARDAKTDDKRQWINHIIEDPCLLTGCP